KFQRHLRQVRTQGVPLVSDLLLRGGDTEHRIAVQLSSLPIKDQHRRVSQLLVSLVDITGRKLDEQTLRASEESLRTLIEASPHPVKLKDANLRWQFANKATLDLFDLNGMETRGLTNKDLAECSPGYREALLQRELCDRDVITSGRLDRRDEIIRKPDGS